MTVCLRQNQQHSNSQYDVGVYPGDGSTSKGLEDGESSGLWRQ